MAAKLSLEKAVPQGWSRGRVACSLAVQGALRCVCSSQVCPALRSKGRASQGCTVWKEIASGSPSSEALGGRSLLSYFNILIY